MQPKDPAISDGSASQRRRSTRYRIRPDRFGSSSCGRNVEATTLSPLGDTPELASRVSPEPVGSSSTSTSTSTRTRSRSRRRNERKNEHEHKNELAPDTPGSEPELPMPDPASSSSSSCRVSICVAPDRVLSAFDAVAAIAATTAAAVSKLGKAKRKRSAVSSPSSVVRPTPEECAFAVEELGKLHPDVIEKCREIRERTTVTTNVSSDCAVDKDLVVKNETKNKDENETETDDGALSSSLQPSTCGDQVSILDGVVSTMLSQNTTAANSTRAFANLKKAVSDWNLVAAQDDDGDDDGDDGDGDDGETKKDYRRIIETAIHCAGLSQIRASNIVALCKTLKEETGTVSLEYLRHKSNRDIQTDLLRFKGLGPKTVSCVLLFTLGRPDFPVDTHVFRIAKQHKWLPSSSNHHNHNNNNNSNNHSRNRKTAAPSSSRDAAYEYLNGIVPDPLKLTLHCLLVQHGRECHRCAARGKPQFPPKDGTKLVCPLVHLDKIAAAGTGEPQERPKARAGNKKVKREA